MKQPAKGAGESHHQSWLLKSASKKIIAISSINKTKEIFHTAPNSFFLLETVIFLAKIKNFKKKIERRKKEIKSQQWQIAKVDQTTISKSSQVFHISIKFLGKTFDFKRQFEKLNTWRNWHHTPRPTTTKSLLGLDTLLCDSISCSYRKITGCKLCWFNQW